MAKSKTIDQRVGEYLGDPMQRAELARSLAERGWTLGVSVPLEPTPEMVSASMAAVNHRMSRVSKREKHTLRLRAALAALHMSVGALKS